MSIPPSCTIHHTSMLPSENCSTLLGKKDTFLATNRARWAAVVTRTVPKEKTNRIRISKEESLGLLCFLPYQESRKLLFYVSLFTWEVIPHQVQKPLRKVGLASTVRLRRGLWEILIKDNTCNSCENVSVGDNNENKAISEIIPNIRLN